MAQIFDFQDYRVYLHAALKAPVGGGATHGGQSKLARTLGCQPGHISKVLGGDAQLSLEQAILASDFFGHSESQSEYFLVLVERGRAATPRLKAHFDKRIGQLREQHLNIAKRLKAKEGLSLENQITFYSHWYYAAIHAALSLPEVTNAAAVAERLGLSRKKVENALAFLERAGLVARKGAKLVQTMSQTHLGRDSVLLSRHHAGWRLQAIRSLEGLGERDLHFSSVVTLSKEDAYKIRTDLVKAVEEATKKIVESKEEVIYGFCADFFEL